MVKRLVVDASVAIKWLIPQQPEEANVPQALALLQKVEAEKWFLCLDAKNIIDLNLFLQDYASNLRRVRHLFDV